MDTAVTKCPACGKLFAYVPGKAYCVDCRLLREQNEALVETAVGRHGKRTVQEIAALTGLPAIEVERIVKSSSILRREVESRARCARCQEQPAAPGSDFCSACRMELYRAFGDAADELFTRLEVLEPRPQPATETSGLAMSVLSSLEQKRARAGATRFYPAPRHRIR